MTLNRKKNTNKSKTKILLVSPLSYPYFYKNTGITSGGAELQMSLIAKELAKIDKYEVLFFVGKYDNPKIDYVEGVKLIRAFSLPKRESIISKIIKAIKYFFLLAKYKPNVVISTTANAIVGLTAFYKKFIKYKYIYRTAGKVQVEFLWIKENGFLGNVFKYGLNNADKIIVQNQEQIPIIQKNINQNPIVLKNIFNWDNTNENKQESFILWVGRVATVKQPELFIKIAAKFPHEKFCMICNYDGFSLQKWKGLNIEANKLKNLDFKDQVNFNEINMYYNAAKIFINTSISEGFPNSFLQAAAAKTPIVTLNVNPDNFLNEYNCGICCDNDFDLMIESINDLIKDKTKAKIMGENAHKYLIENHNPTTIINKLAKVIEEK